MAFKLVATHVPTGEVEEFGPWEVDPDPLRATAMSSFAHGFVCGLFTKAHGVGFDAADLDVQVAEVPGPNALFGQVVAEASASVTRADGSAD